MPFVRRFSSRAALIITFFAALWFVLFRQLSGEWSLNDQYSYGWFVPFFAALLFWLRWEDAPKAREDRGQKTAIRDERTKDKERITNKATEIVLIIVSLM